VRHHHRQPCRECATTTASRAGSAAPVRQPGIPPAQPRPNCTHRDQPPRRTWEGGGPPRYSPCLQFFWCRVVGPDCIIFCRRIRGRFILTPL
jgi:hypothetical protein